MNELMPRDVAAWYAYRAEQIENRTGLIENGLIMLQWAIDKFIPHDLIEEKIEKIQLSLDELSDFVYVWGLDKSVSLDGFKTMTQRSKLDIYIARLDEIRPEISTTPSDPHKHLLQLIKKVLNRENDTFQGRVENS